MSNQPPDGPLRLSTGTVIERARLTHETPRQDILAKMKPGFVEWWPNPRYTAIKEAIEKPGRQTFYPPSLQERRVWGAIGGEGPHGEAWEMWTVVERESSGELERIEDDSLGDSIQYGMYEYDYGRIATNRHGQWIDQDGDPRKQYIEIAQSAEELCEAFGIPAPTMRTILSHYPAC